MSLQAYKLAGVVGGKASGVPDAAQLEAVNRLTLDNLIADQVYVRTAWVAHNAIDRDDEAFSDALLADFASTLPGKGLFIKHPMSFDGDSGPGVGRWFGAWMVSMSLDEARAALRAPDMKWPPGVEQAQLLEASFYIPRTNKHADLIADIDAGVAADVSIGFRASKRAPIEQDGEHAGALLFGPGEALEASLVYLGAQPGARITKAADKHYGEEQNVDELNELKTQNKTLRDEKAAAEQKAQENEAKAKSFDSIKEALGDDHAALLDKPDQLKARLAEADEYRKSLIDDVVAFDRLNGLVGDSDEDVKQAKAMYAGADIKTLADRADAGRKKYSGKSQLEGGDPNTTGASGKDPNKPDGEKGAGGLRDDLLQA